MFVAVVTLVAPTIVRAQGLGVQVAIEPVTITAFELSSAGARAGLRVGDRIVALGGRPVANRGDLRALETALSGKVLVRVMRGSRTLEGTVDLGPALADLRGAAPAPTAGGIRTGLYNCTEWASGGMAVVRRVEIRDARTYVLHTYNDREALVGTYRFDARSGAITWDSGPLAGYTGSDYKLDEPHQRMRLMFGDPGFHTCFLSEG